MTPAPHQLPRSEEFSLTRGARLFCINIGLIGAISTLLLVVLAVWFTFTLQHPVARWFFAFLLISGLTLPLLFKPLLLRWPRAAFAAMRITRLALIARVILHALGTWPLTDAQAIAMIAITFYLVGTQIWLLSDPRILTTRGEKKLVEGVEQAIKARLRDPDPAPARKLPSSDRLI